MILKNILYSPEDWRNHETQSCELYSKSINALYI